MSAKESYLRIAGTALLLLSAALLGFGTYQLVVTGTCSSTGFADDYGSVAVCPPETDWWLALELGGLFGCLVGASLAESMRLGLAGVFGAIGGGALVRLSDANIGRSDQVFAVVFGGSFALLGLVFALLLAASAIRSMRAPAGDRAPGRQGPVEPPGNAGLPAPSLEAPRPEAGQGLAAELSKLAELHAKGALTDEEFASAKARLLERG